MSKQKNRTQKINIEEESQNTTQTPLQRVLEPEQNQHYELHIGSSRLHQPNTKKTIPKKQILPHKAHQKIKEKATKKISVKIWNFLEWIALSSLIFAIFFFAMNFQSYTELFKLKYSKITGTYQVDPYIEEAMGNDNIKPSGIELLPLEKNTREKKQPVPDLSLAVAPPDNRIIIPRINKNVPIVNVSTQSLIRRDWAGLEADIQEALKGGVVHYPGTAEPGQNGNVVVTGHSSYFPWDPGRFKDVFALLHDVVVGDEILIYNDQKPYRYTVTEKTIVLPDKIDVLTQQGEDKLTLITCTPVGTNLKRLIVVAKPVAE
jgi:LPXTG-site transpeptidase (sortase) family protein